MKSFFVHAFLAVVTTGFVLRSNAQIAPERYRIEFTDKINSPFSIAAPEAFLSQRAINRRQQQGIVVTEQDLPVNPTYVQGIEAAGAIEVLHRSRWFNSIVVRSTDTAALDTLSNLPYVSGVKRLQPVVDPAPPDPAETEKVALPTGIQNLNSIDSIDYGQSYLQLAQVNINWLHRKGILGEGQLIAIVDGGFIGTDDLPAFEHLRNDGRIIAVHDFVDNDKQLYAHSTHGTRVLSVMAGVLPGELYGAAPAASYVLLRSEDTGSEYRVEEDNWIAAAEFADSCGVDILVSSLGYNIFDDSNMDYSYADFDGNTTRIARAADFAVARGMAVVVSAGNEGDNSWGYITTPADADSVLAIGSVNASGTYSNFSSRGPASDGRIKPDVVALGDGTVVTNNIGSITQSNGTSFATPIVAGGAALLWQAKPDLTAQEIVTAIRQSANQYENPDATLGYGLPDFLKAWLAVTDADPATVIEDALFVFPNPFSDQLQIDILSPVGQAAELQVADLSGKLVLSRQLELVAGANHLSWVPDTAGIDNGIYVFSLLYETGERTVSKVMRLKH